MSDKKTFVCDNCDYSSQYKANLERHRRAKHPEKENSTTPNASSSEPSVDDILEDLKRSKITPAPMPAVSPHLAATCEDEDDDDEIPITEYIDARIEQRMGTQNTPASNVVTKASSSITGTFGSVAFGFALAWMAMNNYSMIKTMIVGTIGAGEKKTIPPELLRALSEKQPPMPYLPSAEVPLPSASSTPSSSLPVCAAPSSSL
jgi:hypothetical protein